MKNYISAKLVEIPEWTISQHRFWTSFFQAWLYCPGRKTFENLGRLTNYSTQTLYNYADNPPDFQLINQNLIESMRIGRGALLWDASFIPKTGKKTSGLAWFWNGSESRAEKGLEISALSVADPERKTAFHLDVKQTPANAEPSRIEFYLQQILEKKEWLRKQKIKHIVTDNYCAKVAFIKGLRENELHHVSRFRKDANLYYLSGEPKQKTRGRPKKYAGKIKLNELDFSSLKQVEPEKNENYAIYHLVCYAKRLKAVISLVIVKPSKNAALLLYSTDLELDPRELANLYKLRFQQEFIFRDAKQNAGLTHAQTLTKQRLQFHFDMSLTSCNFAKTQFFERRKHPSVFSIASISRDLLYSILKNEFSQTRKIQYPYK
jgi:hypothetical protein